MALTPGSYVPQGQVGTGAAYVHEIKDRSGYLDALAKAAEKQRLEQEKQIAKVKGFDYGVVTDPVMKEHIQKKYKEGLTTFAQIVAAGGDVNSVTTPEGIAFSAWTNQIKDEADTAKLAESKLSTLRASYNANPDKFDTDLVQAAISEYNEATTPDAKLAASINLDPILIKNFDYNTWIQEEIDNAKTDKEITSLGKETTEYQNVFNKKLEQIPEILATKPGYKLAEKQWQKRKANGEEGFQQDTFQEFLIKQVNDQKYIREFKSESPAPKSNIFNINTGRDNTPDNSKMTPVQNTQGIAINIPDLKEAFEGKSPTHQAFWVYGPNNVPRLVLKGKGGDPAAYGVDANVAIPDPDDENNGIQIKGEMLWKFRIPTQGQVFQPQDKSELSRQFKDATFFDESGKVIGGEPADMYQDQLGNLWLDLSDKNGGIRHILVDVGGYTQTYKDQYGKVVENPLKSIAKKNQVAIEKSLGISSFSEFANKYFYNNINITK